MELKALREEVLEANLELVRAGLVVFTFGNASGFDEDSKRIVIKPSGVPYNQLTPAHLVVTDRMGTVLEGSLRPSSDLLTHVVLYQSFAGIGGVVHTHSRYATAWAQAGLPVPCLGTTHADYFPGEVPVTSDMLGEEIESNYEWNTGQVIVRRLAGVDHLATTAVLVAGHAPFCWGPTPSKAAHTAAALEEVAHLAYLTTTIRADVAGISPALRDKHFLRKHGPRAYYGQQ